MRLSELAAFVDQGPHRDAQAQCPQTVSFTRDRLQGNQLSVSPNRHQFEVRHSFDPQFCISEPNLPSVITSALFDTQGIA
jgi:hypothetical protein